MLIADIIKYKIYDYLSYKDCVNFQNTCKTMPKLKIRFFTFKNKINYKGKHKERCEISYLLSDKNIEESPSQLKNNFLDIRLNRGNISYYFIIYENIYDPKKDILDYLKNIHKNNYTKRLFLVDGSFKN